LFWASCGSAARPGVIRGVGLFGRTPP
jgi:hypothetical protein